MSNKKSISFVFNNLLEKVRKNKKIQLILVSILVFILLITFVFSSNNNEEKSAQNTDEITSYVNDLESKLSNVLSQIEGAGSVSVIITVESGWETVLAMKTTSKTDVNGVTTTESTPILVNGKTVVVKQLYPKIVGVLVVASGAKNISVMTKLQQATASLLDVDINKIEILAKK